MGLLDRLFRRSKASAPEMAEPETTTACPHTTLIARWDSAEDMGIEDKATSFLCTACESTFTPEEARELRETIAARLRQNLS